MSIVVSLAWSGLRHRLSYWLLLSLGVALAAALPVLAAGLRLEASTAAVRGAVDALPPSSRAVVAVTSGDLRGADLTRVTSLMQQSFSALDAAADRHVLTFRPLAFAGQDVTLGAVDRLADDVRLTSGRMPSQCTPTHCEVVAMVSPGKPALDLEAAQPKLAEIGVFLTGTGVYADSRLAGVGLVETGPPLLLGSDPDALTNLSALELFGRNTAWLATLDGAAVAAAGVPEVTRQLTALSEQANTIHPGVTVSWPSPTVQSAYDRARASADRFAALGAGGAFLQLGFGLVIAAGLRRRQVLVAQLLARRGASPLQLTAMMILQPLVTALAGAVVGAVGAALIVGWRVRHFRPQPAADALHAVISAWPTLLGLVVAGAAVAAAMFRWPPAADRAARWILSGALAVSVGLAVLLVRGNTGGGATALTVSTILALLMATGLLTAQLWAPVLAGLARLLRRRPAGPVLSLAVTVGRRRPLLHLLVAGFVAAACALGILTGSYRSSLVQSAEDQAAYAVPLDIRLTSSSRVAVPLDVLDTEGLRAAAPDAAVFGLVTASVSAFAGSPVARSAPLVGIDPAALPRMHQFAATTGSSRSAAELAQDLTVPATDRPDGPTIPAGTQKLTIRATGLTGDIATALWVATAQGRERQLPLTAVGSSLVATVPPGPDLFVRAFEVTESELHLTHRQHAIGEGRTDRQLSVGDLALGAIDLDGRPADWSWAGWAGDRAENIRAEPTRLSFHYRIDTTRVVLLPGGPPAPVEPLPVAVDPDTARTAGERTSFSVAVNGASVPVRVVAVLPRMPGLGAAYLIADRSAVTQLLDRTAPGTAAVSQVWIAAPGPALQSARGFLDNSAAATATVEYRTDRVTALRTDPVATRSILLLAIAGAMALMMALVAAAAAVRADLDQTAADSYALELDGMTTTGLRLLVGLRTALSVALGVPFGILGGAVLAAVTVRLLVLGPGGSPAVPPLQVLVWTPTTAAILGVALVGGLAACVVAVAPAFGEPSPQAAEMDLR